MAAYSAASLVKKLGIKPDSKVLFINEPATFYKDLDLKDENEKIKTYGKSPDEISKFDYIHYFASSKSDLKKFF